MSRKRRAVLVVIGILSSATACSKGNDGAPGAGGAGETAPAASAGLSGSLNVVGSSTVAAVIEPVSAAFSKKHPGVDVSIEISTSSRGVKDSGFGLIDVGLSTRDLYPSESGLEVHRIAEDGLAVVVHQENPVRSLTDEQIVGIFTGAIENWSEVGGENTPIQVLHASDPRASLLHFMSHFELSRTALKAAFYHGSDQQAVDTVLGEPATAAYVSIAFATRAIENGSPIALIGFGGAKPTMENVGSGAYPLTFPLALVTKADPDPLAAEFVKFATSAEAAKIFASLKLSPPTS